MKEKSSRKLLLFTTKQEVVYKQHGPKLFNYIQKVFLAFSLPTELHIKAYLSAAKLSARDLLASS